VQEEDARGKAAETTDGPRAARSLKGARGAKKKRTAYHHGDLRRQLLSVAEEIILERGVDGFTLREAARRAGVSPAAPAHHFKDARGLLTEVARLGFEEFGDAIAAADKEGGADPVERLRAQAVAYVRFALQQPARFQLMFRSDKLDGENAELLRVGQRAYKVLEDAICAETNSTVHLMQESYGLLLAVWSMVHGFSHLALGGQLKGPNGAAPSNDATLKTLLPLMLKYLPVSGIKQV
jgi:AcrR family transcriptional regulator